MNRAVRVVVGISFVLGIGTGLSQAEQAQTAQAMDSEKQAAMEEMKRLGSPSEGHKALELFVGNWTYTAQFWMSPDAPAQSMTGTTTNTLIFGGRFLKQEVTGEAMEGFPPFEGLGFTGYDNIRQEYHSVWFDNMGTGIMVGTGEFDAATKSITEEGDFSCPMTGESHREFRAVWTVVDADHNTYESYMSSPDGQEFKAMELHYTRAQ